MAMMASSNLKAAWESVSPGWEGTSLLLQRRAEAPGLDSSALDPEGHLLPPLLSTPSVGGADSKLVSAMNNVLIRILASTVKDINQENGVARGRDKVAPDKTKSLTPIVSFAVWARPRISSGQVYRVGGMHVMKGDEEDE